ncbi:MAG: hypothetical protein AAF513_20315 [Pseudomonadota bacterium]
MNLKQSTPRVGLFGCAALLIAACSSEPEGNSGAALTAAMQKSSPDMPAEIAECFGRLAEDELSANGRALLIAGMQQDEAGAKALREQMNFTDIAAAGMFMVSAGGRCGVPEE